MDERNEVGYSECSDEELLEKFDEALELLFESLESLENLDETDSL